LLESWEKHLFVFGAIFQQVVKGKKPKAPMQMPLGRAQPWLFRVNWHCLRTMVGSDGVRGQGRDRQFPWGSVSEKLGLGKKLEPVIALE
jgi:hypothetical protein